MSHIVRGWIKYKITCALISRTTCRIYWSLLFVDFFHYIKHIDDDNDTIFCYYHVFWNLNHYFIFYLLFCIFILSIDDFLTLNISINIKSYSVECKNVEISEIHQVRVSWCGLFGHFEVKLCQYFPSSPLSWLTKADLYI